MPSLLAAADRLMTGRTVVMVAHRLRAVHRANRAAFVVHGRIADATRRLLRLDDRYRKFWKGCHDAGVEVTASPHPNTLTRC